MIDKRLFEELNATLAAYIRAQVTACLLIGVVCTIGFLLIGVPYAIVLGIEVVGRIAPRMGFPPGDVEVLTRLVRHHLLLAEVATRRDLSDEARIAELEARTQGKSPS